MNIRLFPQVLILFAIASIFSKYAMAESIEYKVLTLRHSDIEKTINRKSKDGWRVSSVTTSSECRFNELGGQVKSECQIVILERKK
jgi:hypothetical protein